MGMTNRVDWKPGVDERTGSMACFCKRVVISWSITCNVEVELEVGDLGDVEGICRGGGDRRGMR